MIPSRPAQSPSDKSKAEEKIAYIQQLLAELSVVARAEGADMLGYLIDMAYEEALDMRKRL
jgi:hypothetical protein